MKSTNYTNNNYKLKQLKLPLEIEKIIEISDSVYSFCEIVDCIDLNSYFVKEGYKMGRPRYNRANLLKIILFSFMENGYLSLRGKEYKERLQDYAKHIEICGEKRGSYSKTDKSATFMRIKTDYMGNDQLLPAYNLQIAVCEEYIAALDVEQYASDMDCFVPLMEKFLNLKS